MKQRAPRPMRSRRRSASAFTLALACAGALVLLPSVARADDEAVVRFERGVQLYEAENFDAALIEFATAYKLSKNFKLLYNIGICQMATKEYGAAADSFRQYLSEGGAEIQEARRKDVQDRLAKLGLMITRVRVSTNAPAGTVLLIDDRPAGTAPFTEPLSVKTGRRQFSVVVNGRTFQKSVDVTSGDVAAVDLHVDITAPADANTSGPDVTKPSGPAFPWPLWVLTGVLGGGAVVTGILAVNARNDFGEGRAKFGASPGALDDDRSRAQTFGYVTDGLIVGTVIAAGFSTYFTIRHFNGKKSAGSTALTVTPASLYFSRSF